MITEVKVGTEKLSDPPFFLGLGSCFVNNLTPFLNEWGYDYIYNPLGTTFNPISIAKQLKWIFSSIELNTPFKYNDVFHQLDASNHWQNVNKEDLLFELSEIKKNIQDYVSKNNKQLVLIISFGTAHAWFKETQLVSNCHKLPGSLFKRQLLSTQQIIEYWKLVFDVLPPYVQVIFTVSPVRYTKIGLQDNFLGKSILRLAIEELIQYSSALYFPSFEIIHDELRNYDFYEPNGTHPNKIAIEVVMKRFKEFLQL